MCPDTLKILTSASNFQGTVRVPCIICIFALYMKSFNILNWRRCYVLYYFAHQLLIYHCKIKHKQLHENSICYLNS